MKNQTSSLKGFKQYLEEINAGIQGHTETQGIQNGQVNRPKVEAEYMPLIGSYIHSQCQSLLNKNQQYYLPISGMAIATKIKEEADARIAGLRPLRNEQMETLKSVMAREEELRPSRRNRQARRLARFGLGMVSICEGFFAYDGLRYAGFMTITAIVTAVAVAAAISLLVESTAPWISKAITFKAAVVRFLIVTIPASTFFSYLGFLRAGAYNAVVNLNVDESVPTTMPGISMVGVTMMSILLFVTALVVTIKYCKTDQEKLQEQEHDKVLATRTEIEAKITQLDNNIVAIQTKAEVECAEALTNWEEAKANEKLIVSYSDMAQATFGESNLKFRTDDNCPYCISVPPQLHYTFFFDTLKTDN